jgi:3-oxoacyl-[acyl-carrier protein] reductase
VGDPFDLSGRVAFVTGAGSGLGRAISTTLAGAGAMVSCADLALAGAQGTAADIVAAGGQAEAAELDVTVRSQVASVLTSLAANRGRLDVVCNVAGIPGDRSLVVDIDEQTFDRIFAVHFKGVLFGCQLAAKLMIPAGRGSIVNMTSTAIDTPGPTLGTYSVAKAAISQLTRVLASEVGQFGIRVNAVAPGYVETPLSLDRFTSAAGVVEEEQRAEMRRQMEELAALPRLGTPEDVAAQVLYLASDASAFVTGQTLRVNGGASMPW